MDFLFLKKRTHTQCLPIKYIFKRAEIILKFLKYLKNLCLKNLTLEFGIIWDKTYIYLKMIKKN